MTSHHGNSAENKERGRIIAKPPNNKEFQSTDSQPTLYRKELTYKIFSADPLTLRSAVSLFDIQKNRSGKREREVGTEMEDKGRRNGET